jgi:exopolysaccharide production protein ExoZ
LRTLLDATLGRLGRASYVLYLIHEPVGSLAIKVIERFSILASLSASAVYGLCVVTAVAIALLVHFTIEVSLLQWLRKALLLNPAPAKQTLVERGSAVG